MALVPTEEGLPVMDKMNSADMLLALWRMTQEAKESTDVHDARTLLLALELARSEKKIPNAREVREAIDRLTASTNHSLDEIVVGRLVAASLVQFRTMNADPATRRQVANALRDSGFSFLAATLLERDA
jgi:hypothetical protein